MVDGGELHPAAAAPTLEGQPPSRGPGHIVGSQQVCFQTHVVRQVQRLNGWWNQLLVAVDRG